MKKIISIIGLITFLVTTTLIIQGCAAQKEKIANKTGVQLWAENCMRCHNTPSPTDFTDQQWTTIGLHMQIRANLTKVEAEKIVEFLKSAN